jgi:uncharacterized protein (TIGR03067 family)
VIILPLWLRAFGIGSCSTELDDAMRMQAVIVLGACLAVAADSAPKEAGKKDLEDIQGTWVAIAAEANGAKSEEAKNLKLIIKENKITFNTGARQRESTFELDPTKKPKVIVITPLDGRHAGQALRGLYAFEKGMLRLCVNNEKDQSPTEFATHPGDGLRIIVLKRQAP